MSFFMFLISKENLFFSCLLLLAVSVFAEVGKVQVEEFRKGIKTQQDWIDRYKETWDPRILKILISRAGRVNSDENNIKNSEYYKSQPDKFDEALKSWGLTDSKAFEENALNKWSELHGENAWSKTTKHYLVLCTKSNEKYGQLISYYMEKVYTFYEDKFNTGEEIEGRFLVRLFPDRAMYLRETTGAPSFSFAVFRGSARELAGYVPEFSNSREEAFQKNALVHTFFHEGFHQYLGYFVPEPPTWLNEGFAEFFEALSVQKTRLVEKGNLNEYDLRMCKELIKENSYTDIKTFLYMSQQEFYSNWKAHYPQGWAVVHFLAFGSKSYNKYFKDLMTHLKNGVPQKEAMDQVFSNVDFDKFDASWTAYIQKLNAKSVINSYIY